MEFLLNTVLIVTATALLVLLAKKLFAKVLTPRQQMALWLILLLQICILPIGNLIDGVDIIPKSNLSLQNYIPSLDGIEMKNLSSDGLGESADKAYSGGITLKTLINGEIFTKELMLSKYQFTIIMDAIILLWIIGMSIMAAILLCGYIKFSRKCKQLELVKDYVITSTKTSTLTYAFLL